MKNKWIRYRFKTYSFPDDRPLIFNPKFPWWESGFASDESYAIIVAWLPEGKDLLKYWDDADDIESTEHDKIEFSDRFDKPDYFIES